MKTLAIALFASLALSACATDEADDLQPIDKISEQRDVQTATEELDDRAGQVLVPEGVGLQPGTENWAEELIGVDGKQWTIVHGPRGAEALLDDRGLSIPAPEGIDALLEQLGLARGRLDLKRVP